MRFQLLSLLITAIFYFSNINPISCQITYEERIEFELKDGFDADFIIPQGKAGFLLITEDQKSKGKETNWEYRFYNNQLKEEEVKRLSIDKKFSSFNSFQHQEASYTFFKNKKGEFEIIISEKSDNSISRTKGSIPKKFEVGSFYVLNEFAYLSGKIKKSPALIAINLNSGLSKIIPLNIGDFKPKDTKIVNFQVKPKSNEFILFMSGIDSRKESDMYMLIGEENRIKSKSLKRANKGSKNIISISDSKLNDQEYTITGTYGENSISTSKGIFFGKMDTKKVRFIHFTKFLDLKDFLSYLPEKKQDKIEKKRNKKKKKGKDVKLSYFISDHDVIKTEDGGFILIGEAYYPTYRTEARTTYVNGQATTTYVTVFDGYQYTHAIVTKFSAEGELIWDNSFKMYPLKKPFTVTQFISVFGTSKGAINLAYSDSGSIHTKSISDTDGKVLSEKESEKINTGFEGDKTKSTNSDLNYWYDNYFIVYGFQTIKNKGDDKDKRGKRKVFFVSKVKFES
tara:strand:- start:2406 stop:3938 length:1533 start_codon:yes stop_codon:yes gene_type:complete